MLETQLQAIPLANPLSRMRHGRLGPQQRPLVRLIQQNWAPEAFQPQLLEVFVVARSAHAPHPLLQQHYCASRLFRF